MSMNHNVIETAMGAVVLAAAGIFLVFAMKTAKIETSVGYNVTASFSNASGLLPGADVRVGGVKVGSVTSLSLDPRSYQALAHLTLENGVQVPDDSSATIRSESLLGGKYLAIEPGGSDRLLTQGGNIAYTQSTPDLEQLLGQAIFSMSGAAAKKDDPAPEPAAKP